MSGDSNRRQMKIIPGHQMTQKRKMVEIGGREVTVAEVAEAVVVEEEVEIVEVGVEVEVEVDGAGEVVEEVVVVEDREGEGEGEVVSGTCCFNSFVDGDEDDKLT